MTARIVWFRGVVARRRLPNSGKMSSRWAARLSTPNTPHEPRQTRLPAASRRASGKSRRPAGHPHRSARKSSTTAVTRRQTAAAGKRRPRQPPSWTTEELPSGPRRCSLSPETLSALLVARMLISGAPLNRGRGLAAASMTCAQLFSSSASACLQDRRPGRGSDPRHGFPARARLQLCSAPGAVAERRQIDQPRPCS